MNYMPNVPPPPPRSTSSSFSPYSEEGMSENLDAQEAYIQNMESQGQGDELQMVTQRITNFMESLSQQATNLLVMRPDLEEEVTNIRSIIEQMKLKALTTGPESPVNPSYPYLSK